ncbi:MAG TPA: NB-ARC domain-containing protein, partial [Anaerolineae bacterium]|nr:NB-ARC domain-containing protein [Anaerolineae bacterium]
MSLSDLLDLLNQRFSLEDVRTLCFILRIEYDNLGGEGKKNKLRELILTLRQEGRLVELIDAAEEEKPNIRNLSWDDVRNDIANLQEEYFKNRPAENFNHDHTNPDTPVIPIPMQIPRLIPHFVGRERYLDEVRACLHTDMHQRVVGLVGLPGVGKTAIAIHALYGLQEEFTDGIIWVDVDISNPEAELTSIAAHFGQSEAVAAIPDLANKSEFVRDILLHKKLLLVLNQVDNEEQIKWLLPTGDNNYVLITTRNGHVLTRMGAVIIPVRPFTEMEAMVFLETAVGQQRVRQETQAAHNIIHNLGFLPLALSVASSQLEQAPNLTLAEFASLIEDEKTRLHNLSDWDSTERDITISLELSYRQLPDAHQQLFRALAVFDGPDFSAEAVAAVVNQPLTQVKLGLSRLFTHSLLGIGLGERHTILPIENQEKNRYRLNPLIKLFAQYKLSPPLKKEEEPPPPDKTSPQKASRSGWLSAANRTLGTPEPAPEPDPPLRGGWMQAA